MLKRILDTCVLLAYWKRRTAASDSPTVADVERWAQELAEIHQGNAIVTPVYVEFIAGTRDSSEQHLAEAFLAQFEILDKGEISRQDWDETRRIAKRIPPRGKPRQLGDCLIRAIANRLKHEVVTADTGFPR